jgi:hypothetical protein
LADLQTLFNELVRLEIETWNAVDARLRSEHALPLSRFEPMRVIASTPDCRVYDIATALSLTAAGKRLLDKAAKTFDDELQERLGSVLPDRSLAQLTESLIKLRGAPATTSSRNEHQA